MRHILKDILRFFVKVLDTAIQLMMILFFIKIKYLKNLKPVEDDLKLVILGNGPSLENDFSTLQELKKLTSIRFLCVNNFASYKHYEIIKPTDYIVIDPVYFIETPNIKKLNEMKETLQTDILNKTKWPLNLYFPKYYVNSSIIRNLSGNININLIPINNVPLSGGFETIKQKLFSYNIGNPIFQNVLISAIFIGIQKKFKEILIYGADHSWLNNITVLENNHVVLNDKHISNNDTDQTILVEENGNPKQLHTFLSQLSVMFEEYHTLNKYAESKKITVINMTKKSFIDAFSRNPKS